MRDVLTYVYLGVAVALAFRLGADLGPTATREQAVAVIVAAAAWPITAAFFIGQGKAHG